jgi:hypothetical protein
MKIIIKVEYGGLGDHLFHSPLPRLLKENKYATKVFLSSESSFRSHDIFNFVWKDNPYLDGISSKSPTKIINLNPQVDKIMNKIAACYGVNNIDYEIIPEIFCNFKVDNEFKDNKYLDLNYISFVGAFSFLDEIEIIKKMKDYILVNPQKYLLPFIGKRYIKTRNFDQYISLIYSCKSFACLTSGGASVSAAFSKTALVFYGFGHPDTNRHSINNNILIGGEGFLRRQLCRYLFKKNQLRLAFSRNK